MRLEWAFPAGGLLAVIGVVIVAPDEFGWLVLGLGAAIMVAILVYLLLKHLVAALFGRLVGQVYRRMDP